MTQQHTPSFHQNYMLQGALYVGCISPPLVGRLAAVCVLVCGAGPSSAGFQFLSCVVANGLQ